MQLWHQKWFTINYFCVSFLPLNSVRRFDYEYFSEFSFVNYSKDPYLSMKHGYGVTLKCMPMLLCWLLVVFSSSLSLSRRCLIT